MTVYIDKLTYLIQAAGIPVYGVSDVNGTLQGVTIQFPSDNTQAQIDAAYAIVHADNGQPLGYVDATQVGNTLIGKIDIVGQNLYFVPTNLRVITRKISGVTTRPTISVGTNSPNYNNGLAATQLPASLGAVNAYTNFPAAISPTVGLIAVNDGFVYCRVSVAATGSSPICLLYVAYEGEFLTRDI